MKAQGSVAVDSQLLLHCRDSNGHVVLKSQCTMWLSRYVSKKRCFYVKFQGGLITVRNLHFADFSVQMKQFDLFIICPLLLLFSLEVIMKTFAGNLIAKACVVLNYNS